MKNIQIILFQIQSCCSNLGSRQTLNQSFEEREPPSSYNGHMTTGGGGHLASGHSNSPVNNNNGHRYRSQANSIDDMDQSFEHKPLDRTHATLTGTIDRKQLHAMTGGGQNSHGPAANGQVYGVGGGAGKLVKGLGNDIHGSLPVLYYNGKPGTDILTYIHQL